MKNKLPFLITAILLACAVYSNLNQLWFASVDDDWMLLNEKLIRSTSFNLQFLREVFSRINSLQYSPVNTIYYYLVYQINGYDAYWFHLFSFFIHLLNVVLIYVLTKKIITVYKLANADIIAWSVALLWAVVPFNVEAVVWISASKILLYTFLGILSFIFFIEAFLNGKKSFYLLSIISFILSCLCKEQAVLFPLMMGIFVFTYQKGTAPENFKKKIGFLLPFLAIAFLFGLVSLYVAIYGVGTHDIPRYDFSQRIVLSFFCIGFYIFNLFIPVNLHYHYPFPVPPGTPLPISYYIYPFAMLLIGWQLKNFLKNNANRRFYFFCIGVFIIHLLLCVQIFPLVRASMLADRYMYIPSIGLIMLILCFLNNTFRPTFDKFNIKNTLLAAGYSAYLLTIAIYSHNLIENWKTMSL